MHDILDLETYPLDHRESADFTALVRRCQCALETDGMFSLPGFLRADARRDCLDTVLPRFASESFRHARSHNIYFRRVVPGLRPDHPALALRETVNHTLCGDRLADTALHAIYHWAAFAGFLAAVMDKPALHVMDDPLAGFNVMRYGEGEALNWHFDRSEFTTTLLLQAASTGGAFEYAHELRSDSDPNHDGVAALLQGRLRTQIAPLAPGTLNVFRGKNTAHRVTPSGGADPRVITVFSYYEHPGKRFSAEEQLGFYGRTG